MNKTEKRVMSIMAHQDDFEFNAGGFFALLRRNYGENVRLKIVTTTRGASGHHEMSLEETAARRDREARASAATINAEYENLVCLDGKPLESQIFPDRNTLGGVWNVMRSFSPDYIICPPVIVDPRAGIHIDHYNTAWAVRMVAYQYTVPHAYPLLSSDAAGRRLSPLIMTVDDGYAAGNEFDVALDISSVYEQKENMAFCHESQVFEWLPWNGNRPAPDREEYLSSFRERHVSTNRRYINRDDGIQREYFNFTLWGRRPNREDFDYLFPNGMLSERAEALLN